MKFHDLTIELTGDKFSARVQDTTAVEPAAVAYFAGLVAGGGCDKRPLPPPAPGGLSVTWIPQDGCAVLTFWWRGTAPVTMSVLATGRNTAAEAGAFAAVARTARQVLRAVSGGAAEPGFDLLAIAERPAIASVVFFGPPAVPADVLAMVADMETCVAAAYFSRAAE